MGWIRDIGEILQGETHGPAPKLLYGRIDETSGWDHDGTPAVPGTAYMQWFLQEMWLPHERQWLDHFAPIAYSSVTLSFGNKNVEIPRSLGDFKFAGVEDLKNLQDTLRPNYPMTHPLPYNGGVVELSAALVGLKTSSGLKEMMTALDQLSAVLAVPQLSAVVAVAGPVANTLDSVLGQSKEHLELGVHQAFKYGSEEQLRSGYYLAAHREGGPKVLSQLMVKNGALCWKRADEPPVREFPYMLFRLEMLPERDDVEELTTIFDWMKKAEEAADGDRMPEARKFVQQAGLAAWNSPDLTRADRKRVPVALRDRFQEFLKVQGLAGDGASVDGPEAGVRALISRTAPGEALLRSDDDVLRAIFAS